MAAISGFIWKLSHFVCGLGGDHGWPRYGMRVPRGLRSVVAGALAFALALMASAGPAAAGNGSNGPVVSWAGAINQNGCPGCCSFSCRLTPTPTPHIDDSGRRIFQRSAGRFLFIVEGALGQSFLPPSTAGTRKGAVIQSLGAFARPGVQVVFDRALGNGSTFVECGTTIVGGVPAAIGLSEAQRTNAMIDAACRFEWVLYSEACTRDRFGGFATVSDDTLVQFCFQVTESAEFPLGDTVAEIQLRDGAGNLGPVEEIVIRVGTPLPTPTPTPTLIGGFAVGGSIASAGGVRPVGGVTVAASTGQQGVSNGAGVYTVTSLPASTIEIVPRKDGDIGDAVSPLDAAWILQSTANMRQLTALQRLACDVTGDGTVSNYDAVEVLKRAVGLSDEFTVAGDSLCGSDWVFLPAASAVANQTALLPVVGAGLCQPGAIRYQPLVSHAAGQSFHAAPYGDCTGNWGASAAAAQGASAPVEARLGRRRYDRSNRVAVPLYLDASRPFHSAAIEIAYDANTLVPRRLRRTRGVSGAMVIGNAIAPGRLRVVLASATAIEGGDQPVAVLRFRLKPKARRSAAGVEIAGVLLDEGR